GEVSTAMAQAARVIETIERITILPLKFVFVVRTFDCGATFTSMSKSRPRAVSAVGDARGLQGPVWLLFRRSDEYLGAGLQLVLAAHDIADHDRLGHHDQLLLAILGQRASAG